MVLVCLRVVVDVFEVVDEFFEVVVDGFRWLQCSRLTFQLASPVASDRFYSLAKINFSLARYCNIHHRIKSSKC